MKRNRFNASDLVVSILAYNPILSESVIAGRLSEMYLKSRICSKYPSKVLDYVNVRPHEGHKDSEVIDEAMNNLIMRGILSRESLGNSLIWTFVDDPKKYFDEHIDLNLSGYRKNQIRKFSREMN